MKPLKFINTLKETEPEMARREYITRVVLFCLFIVTSSFTLISFVAFIFGKMPLDTLIIYAIVTIILIAAIILTSLGLWRAAGIIPPLLLYYPAVHGNYIGGINQPGNFFYAITIILVAIIYGYRKMWIAVVISLTTYLFFAWMIANNYIIPYRSNEGFFINRVVNTSVSIVAIAFMVWILSRSYRSELDERIKAEEALRETEENYRAIFENTGTSMILIEEDMTISMVNAEFVRNTGYSLNEINGRMKWTELVHPNEIERMVEQHRLRREVQGGALPGYELRYLTKTGELRDALLNIQLVPGTKKSVASLIDISERKRAEDALVKSEEKFRLITENMVDCVALVDINGIYQYVTPSYRNVLGYNQEDMIGITALSITHPDDLERNTRIYLEGIKQGWREKYLETRTRHKDGHYVNMELRVRLLNDSQGKVIGAVWAARDITKRLQLEQERKRAEEALRYSEERFRSMIQSLSDIIFVIDGNGELTYESPAATRILGYQPGYFIGKSPFIHIHPDDLDQVLKDLDEVFRSVNPGIPTEFRYRKLDGTWIYLEAIGSNQFENPGIQGIVLTVRDITARKQAEEEKKILQERLQQADKMEAIGTLAGGIAHDFNNLLMGIQGYASMTLMNIDPSNPNYERLKRIEEQVQSGADLTSQLLGFARGGRYEVKPTDINEIIEKTSSMFGRTKKEIAINRKTAKDLWNVEVDRGQMEQVFLNLYVNAWQAMPGGGDIYLETQNVLLNDEKVLPFSGKPGKHVKITITDTGTGMDEKTKERIFDPFFTTKAMGRGTGLGLATVYGIIKGHHGMINVYSEPGHGTTFTIYLPASDKEIPKEKAPIGEIITGTETILLVDDEKMVLEVNRELLESMGYKVYGAGSGQEGIAIYAENKDKIDLVILDMIMPGISGSETFDRLREINPDIKVLLSSGYSLNGEAQTIMDRGCNGFLQKPFRLEELSGKVREMLG